MCAILDANVVHEVFKNGEDDAGKQFFRWINGGLGRLVIGGRLTDELSHASVNFRQWAKTAIKRGIIRTVRIDQIHQTEKDLIAGGNTQSNDIHIIALARVSGARLLFSNDTALHKDFRNKDLIDQPRGKVFSTLKSKQFTKAHKYLLENRNLCGFKS
ncbi:MAG: PIN domain-containing protein [Bacteroidetes bacterium]|nr:PIN domain-containing protein [Bacteroidota bacterium]